MSNMDLSRSHASESILAQHKVLRQTYILLAANVLFSAVCAYVGMLLNVGHINMWVFFAAVFGLSYGIQANRNSGLGIVLLFAFTGFLGFSLSNFLGLIFSMGAAQVVYKALLGTAIIFFGLSFYVLKTGTNFTFLGGFLFVSVMVAFLAALAASFFGFTALQLVCSAAFLLIFSGYVLYDTSNILHGEETNYIIATLNLFMNLYNIFVHLLNLLLAFSGRD